MPTSGFKENKAQKILTIEITDFRLGSKITGDSQLVLKSEKSSKKERLDFYSKDLTQLKYLTLY